MGISFLIPFQKIYGLYGLKHHIVEISGNVTDAQRTDGGEQGKIGLLSFFMMSRYVSLYTKMNAFGDKTSWSLPS